MSCFQTSECIRELLGYWYCQVDLPSKKYMGGKKKKEIHGCPGQAAAYQQEGNSPYVTGSSETYRIRLDVLWTGSVFLNIWITCHIFVHCNCFHRTLCV